MQPLDPDHILPVGTQVVVLERRPVLGAPERFAKPGRVGRIELAPDAVGGLYRVRFADETLVEARRRALAVRRSIAPEESLPGREPRAYEPFLIYRALLGSVAYGLETGGSDRDERGIFLPPAEWHWGLERVPEQVEFKVTLDGRVVPASEFEKVGAIEGDDFTWWEIEKFLRLGLKANPTVLELLWVDEAHVLHADPLARELREIRGAFLSKHLYHTYSGYVLSQFRKMRKRVERGEAFRPKHAMHLVRLLWSGISALRRGEIMVDASAHRDELLEIKRRPEAFERVHARALELSALFDEEFARTGLPDEPDVRRVSEFLIRARRSRVRFDGGHSA